MNFEAIKCSQNFKEERQRNIQIDNINSSFIVSKSIQIPRVKIWGK